MFDRLEFTENKYDELNMKISDPLVIANQKEWQKLIKEQAEVEILVIKYRIYKKAKEDLEVNKEMLREESDKEMKDMIQDEIKKLIEIKETVQEELRILLLPKDPNDARNVFVEIRGGAGGDEAALFAANLFRMYTRYAERNN
ncbi:MAG: PCRF domain-containing protein, partial [Clostridiaceae bacterium]|nr:PCRF domain-containing protein [Clostridiaceae bacterium]